MKISFMYLLLIGTLVSLIIFQGCNKNANIKPMCKILEPSDNDTAQVDNILPITVMAEDKDGYIIEVRYYIDDSEIGLSEIEPYVYEWDTKNMETGSHIIKVVAKDDNAALATDEKSVYIIGYPTKANSGSDQIFTNGTTSTTLSANAPQYNYEKGKWTIVAGEGGSFANDTLPNTVFTGLRCESYTIRWTISTSFDSSSDEVYIEYNDAPTIAEAGGDQTSTSGENFVTLTANTPKNGNGTWSIVNGDGGSFADATKANTIFYGELYEEYVLRWTILTNCENSYDDINIFLMDLLTDIDGNDYKTVKLGSQVWMAENLKTTHYTDNAMIPLIDDIYAWKNLENNNLDDAMCYYNNDINSKYGALYTYAAALKACPAGWHLPSDAEWEIMENYLADNGFNYDGTIGGGRNKISKALATDYGWSLIDSVGAVGNTDYPEYRNKSGFSAIPGGTRSTMGLYNFVNVGKIGYWWTSTEDDSDEAFNRIINFRSPYVYRSNYGTYKSGGFSVRCVRD